MTLTIILDVYVCAVRLRTRCAVHWLMKFIIFNSMRAKIDSCSLAQKYHVVFLVLEFDRFFSEPTNRFFSGPRGRFFSEPTNRFFSGPRGRFFSEPTPKRSRKRGIAALLADVTNQPERCNQRLCKEESISKVSAAIAPDFQPRGDVEKSGKVRAKVLKRQAS